MRINKQPSTRETRFLGRERSDQMKVETVEVPQDEMEEEYLDDALLEKIERIDQSNKSFRPEHGVVQEHSMYEDYLDVKPIRRHQETEVPSISNGLHQGFSCNVCQCDIYGYVCVQCADWDMCASCEARGEHPTHYVLRLPAPRPYAEVQFAIDIIRREFVEKSPGEIRVKKEFDDAIFADYTPSKFKKPELKKSNLQLQAPQKPSPTKTKPETKRDIKHNIKDAIQIKPNFKSKIKPIFTTAVESPFSNVVVSPASSLNAMSTRTFENIKKKPSPVRKKEEPTSTAVKPIMLKFKVPPGMDSKNLLHSLKSGLKVSLDRLPEDTITKARRKS